MTTLRAVLGGLMLLAGVAAGTSALGGVPAAYSPMVVELRGPPAHREFDLSAALQRSRREKKPLYVYLGANDCRYCRRYEAFLASNTRELVPHFAGYIVVDLRSDLSVQADTLYFRVGATSRAYADFQRAIGDERARLLVYPSVWLLDANARPLMQMPAGTGTFETVPEQLEILQLVQ